MQDKSDSQYLSPFDRLLNLAKIEYDDIRDILILAFGIGFFNLATPVTVQSLVNTVAMGGVLQPLVLLSILLLIFLIFSGALSVMQAYAVEMIKRRVFVRIAADVSFRLAHSEVESPKQGNAAELVNRFFDVITLQKSASTVLIEAFAVVLQIVIGLFILAFYHPYLLIFDIIIISSMLFIMFTMGKKGVSTSIKESKAKYTLVAWLEIIARDCHTFKFAHANRFAKQRADALCHDFLAAREKHYRVVLKQTIAAHLLYAFAGTTMLAIGGWLVIQGQLSLGQLVASELIVSMALYSFSKFGKQLEAFYDLIAAVDKIGQLLDLPIERLSGESIQFKAPLSIVIHSLTFGYSTHHRLFDNFNLTVNAGEKIAILGAAARGKTTLVDILCGLKQAHGGNILINEYDLKSLSLDALRSQIAVIKQVELFEDSIYENISLGRADIDFVEVNQIINQLNLAQVINQYPEGLYTLLHNTGSPLSHTQSILVMLARALIASPKLIVIDGLLDLFEPDDLAAIVQLIRSPQAGWTAVITTQSKLVADAFERTVQL